MPPVPINPSSQKPRGQCPKCGRANIYTASLCQWCGATLPWATGLSQQARTAVDLARPTAQNPGKYYLGWSAALLAGIAIIGYFLLPAPINSVMTPPEPEPTPTPAHSVSVMGGSSEPTPTPAPTPMGVVSPQPPAPQSITVRPGPSFDEVDSKMDDRVYAWTEAQKQAYWVSVQGTRVSWAGEVIDIELEGGGEVTLRCNPKTMSSDVRVNLNGSQKALLPTISKGQRVTATGILKSHSMFGYELTGATLS